MILPARQRPAKSRFSHSKNQKVRNKKKSSCATAFSCKPQLELVWTAGCATAQDVKNGTKKFQRGKAVFFFLNHAGWAAACRDLTEIFSMWEGAKAVKRRCWGRQRGAKTHKDEGKWISVAGFLQAARQFGAIKLSRLQPFPLLALMRACGQLYPPSVCGKG